MRGFNHERFANQLASEFYSIFQLKPDNDAVLLADEVKAKRDSIIQWGRKLGKDLADVPVADVQDLYKTLEAKISSGSIGSFEIIFSCHNDGEPKQDRHPLLRTVDFSAHLKRSMQAYSFKLIDWFQIKQESERFAELGDEYEFLSHIPVMTHVFLNVENLGSNAGNHLPVKEAMALAIQYEQDIQDNLIDPKELAQNPELLRQSFDDIVGEYGTGVRVDVPALMKWEAIADQALQSLTLTELRDVYSYFRKPRPEDNAEEMVSSRDLTPEESQLLDDATQWRIEDDVQKVILSEIRSVCRINPQLKPHLEFGGMMSETHCDIRVRHLVGGSGRYISNLDDAFKLALSPNPKGTDLDSGPSRQP